MYRRNADESIRKLERDALHDPIIAYQYIRALERSEDLNNPEILKKWVRAQGVLGNIEDHQDEIMRGIARTFFVTGWAEERERRGLGNGGGDIYYDAPPTPPEAMKFAVAYAENLQKTIGLTLSGFYHFVKKLPHTPEIDFEHFGYLITMSALGHGVGLNTIVNQELVDYVEVPVEDSYMLDNMCDGCGRVEPPFESCENPGWCEQYASLCPDCAETCDDCGATLCATCADEHSHEEYLIEDNIVTEDYKHWYLHGKLYFTGDEESLWAHLDSEGYWPNVFVISDHGNLHPIIREIED